MTDLLATHYCGDSNRVDLARATNLNGIEYVEVSELDGRSSIGVHLLGDPQDELKAESFAIGGGDVITDLEVVEVFGGGTSTLKLTVEPSGDHSEYTLAIAGGAGEAGIVTPPPGFDPVLSVISFRFHAHEASRYDCRHRRPVLRAPEAGPAIDYLAKDYSSFRRVMLDRLSMHLDLERDPSAADLVSALVEAIAYRADQLSYYQDAVATEAYLGTARRRESIRRHARLLDYRLDEGCNARTWVTVQVGKTDGGSVEIRQGTRFLAGRPEDRVAEDEVGALAAAGTVVFEALHTIVARSAHNTLRIYTWGDDECCLHAGTTSVTLAGHPNDDAPSLQPGDVLVFEEVLGGPAALPADADPSNRHAVRLVEVWNDLEDPVDPRWHLSTIRWHEDDALPFDLCVSGRVDPGAPGIDARRDAAGRGVVGDRVVVRGNAVLVDHGFRTTEADDPTALHPSEMPDVVPEDGTGRQMSFQLRARDLTFAVPYSDVDARGRSASEAADVNSLTAIPQVWAGIGMPERTWRAVPDLLASGRFSEEFTVEMTDERKAAVRFGDDVFGQTPRAGDPLGFEYRVGSGPIGNVGADTITTIVQADMKPTVAVRNPLAAVGGREPESVVVARRDAPQAFRTQERAVTPDDYAAAAERHPSVVRAVATRRWTGSWHTVFLTVDRIGGGAVDDAFEAELRGFLERFRLSGHDVEIDSPRPVPLDIAFSVHMAQGFYPAEVELAVRDRLSAITTSDGSLGFFHPDHYTFGQRVYLSQLLAAVGSVEGVAWVDLSADPFGGHRFDRLIDPSGDAVDLGYIEIGRLEIAQLDPSADHPDRGRLEVLVEAE